MPQKIIYENKGKAIYYLENGILNSNLLLVKFSKKLVIFLTIVRKY